MEVLPVALKKKEPEFPQLLELRTRKNFHAVKESHQGKLENSKRYSSNKSGAGASTGQDNQSEKQMKSTDGEVIDPFKANYEELQQVYGFLTENKYVIEAIFENVLLENNLYKFPLSVVSDTERKQLMEKLLSNDEFKEYVYQKTLRGQAGFKEEATESKKEHLVSQAVTQADAVNASMQHSSVINAEGGSKQIK